MPSSSVPSKLSNDTPQAKKGTPPHSTRTHLHQTLRKPFTNCRELTSSSRQLSAIRLLIMIGRQLSQPHSVSRGVQRSISRAAPHDMSSMNAPHLPFQCGLYWSARRLTLTETEPLHSVPSRTLNAPVWRDRLQPLIVPGPFGPSGTGCTRECMATLSRPRPKNCHRSKAAQVRLVPRPCLTQYVWMASATGNLPSTP